MPIPPLRYRYGCAVAGVRGVGDSTSAARLSSAIACWLWLAVLAIACAIWLPGAVPYFLFPSLVAAPLLLATVRGGREVALFVAALAALLIWIGFAAIGEQLMGLGLHEMFTISAALGLVAVLPLLRKAEGLGLSFALSLMAALVPGCGGRPGAGLQHNRAPSG